MLMRLSKRLLILFLALWLPVSVTVAATTTVSMSGAASQEMVAETGEGCPQHAIEDLSDRAAGSCYSCSLCQFACTAMMALAPQSSGFLPGWIAADFVLPALSAYVLDRLQRPPLVL